MKKLPQLFLLLLLCAVPFTRAYACHGVALTGVSVVVSASDVTINASSDPATCGCGPYYMEVEVVPNSAAFNATVPITSSPAWGTAPWFHSILNIPGYGPPAWSDNCVLEPYTPIVIPFSALCTGTIYKYRMREYATGGGTPGPWTPADTFSVPGPQLSPPLTPSASPSLICSGGTTFLDAFGGGCPGTGTFTWAPTAGLSTPNAASTIATATVTTTYTITFWDANLNQTFVDSVTVNIAPPIILIGSNIEASCGFNNGTAMVTASGGFSPYTFLWALNGDTTSSLSNIGTSSYDVTVTDSLGCTQTLSVFVGDSCNPVWPGDANDDSIADNFDLLDIAVAIGATGTSRQNPSIVWNGYPSQDWADTLASGTNYKSVDCNGDGIIDLNDTTAVLLNFGQYHTYRFGAPVYQSNLPDLRILFNQDSVLTGGSIGSAQILLGDNANPATNVYGLAFTVNFDPSQINAINASIYPVQSWLGNPASNMFGADHNDTTGQIAVAFARFDHQNATGGGQIGTISFHTTSALNGTGNAVLVPFTITNVRVISEDESIISVNTVNDSVVVYDDISGIHTFGNGPAISLSPNPNNGEFVLSFNSPSAADYKIEVLNALGQIVYSEEIKQANGAIQKPVRLNEKANGVYLVRVSSAKGQSTAKLICR